MIRLHTLQPMVRLSIVFAVAITLCNLGAINASASERHHKSSKSQSGKVRIQNIRSSSEESTAERDRRLYRECQGRPNSGACAGYTQASPSRRR